MTDANEEVDTDEEVDKDEEIYVGADEDVSEKVDGELEMLLMEWSMKPLVTVEGKFERLFFPNLNNQIY